jgi:hypothetical protein
MTIIGPNQTANFTGTASIDTLSLTNNNEVGNATYTISVGGAAATAHTLEHGTSDNYTVGNGQTDTVTNTGTLNIEADFE